MRLFLHLIMGLVLACLFTAQVHATTVFAAASLKNVLEDIADQYDERVVLSFGGSSMLARQIEYGAPADVFISANEAWMDRLASRNMIRAETRFDVASNRLVLIGQAKTTYPKELEGAIDGRRKVAMALVNAVPAGIYGKAALETFGLWDKAQLSVVQTDNVRAALTLVATGEVELGIVYESDVSSTDDVHVIHVFPEDAHPRILYPVAMTSTGSEQSRKFLQFLKSPEALATMRRHGFLPVSP